MTKTLQTEELRTWIDKHSALYPIDSDKPIEALKDKESFSPSEVEGIYKWKFKGLWPDRKVKSMRKLPPKQVSSLTARAFKNSDDLASLRIVELIPGSGPAGASAVLMAHDPRRYTVMDVRAIRSLAALGRWDVEADGRTATALGWLKYLEACRAISQEVSRSLRLVDRALWQANGNVAEFGPST